MSDYEKIRNSFTSFVGKIIENSSKNYKKKSSYISSREIALTEEIENTTIGTNSNIVDTLEEKINYLNLQNVFTSEMYANAMKKLTDREKLVLYLSAVEEMPLKTIAQIIETTEDNISIIKYRAKKKFLKHLKGDDQ